MNLPPSVRCGANAQRGVALVVALVLLVVATLIGLSGMRGTNLQERMSANMYDRSLAFQRAETALRAAEAAITANPDIGVLGGVDCTAGGALCTSIPAGTFEGGAANWTAVADHFNVNGELAPGAPEYYIQLLGTGNAENDLDLRSNADSADYASPYPPDEVAFYRVTARSSDPADAGDRAVVVLQTTVKRGL